MTGRSLDSDVRKDWDLQLDAELQGTFPASDPLKITRFPVPTHHTPSRTEGLTSPRRDGPRTRSGGKSRRTVMRKKIATDRVRIKRAYEPPASEDGTRVLIDRLWPRGVKKANAAIHEWMKSIAPSTELRKWFGHAPERWLEFQRRYRSEIRQHRAELGRLRELVQDGPVTLVYAAHDEAHNDAVVLRDLLVKSDRGQKIGRAQ